MTEQLEFTTDDELLSASLDGALTDAQQHALEQRLQHEPELAQRLARMRRANAAVRDIYAPVAEEAIPQRALDLLAAPSVIDLASRRDKRVPAMSAWPLALAASVTLAIGVVLGVQIAGRTGDSDLELLARAGIVDAGSPLHAALESGASGSISELNADLRAMPILSFVADDGEYCRQIELGDSDSSAEALACRRNGSWQVDALGFLPDQPFRGSSGGFRPASGTSNGIDAIIDDRIAGDPLDPGSEQALIDNGWTLE